MGSPASLVPDTAGQWPIQSHHSVWLQPQGYLHLQEGPIDLVIGVDGEAAAVEQAYQLMNNCFTGVLAELVSELPLLRTPVTKLPACASGVPFRGAVAMAMWRSCLQVKNKTKIKADCSKFQALLKPLTPMAGVAGAVADHLLAVARAVPGVEKVWVNNGGDIAVHLQGDATFECGIVGMQNLSIDCLAGVDFRSDAAGQGQLRIGAGDGVGGIATSGRHGRSLSLGIADSVTVLARDAVSADIAATLIANAVDLPQHAAIERITAMELDPDSDLGDTEVVVSVAALNDAEQRLALQAGAAIATQLQQSAYIKAALLTLGGQSLAVADSHPFENSASLEYS